MFDLDTVLLTWDIAWEQSKADFLDELFEFYAPTNKCYTGLFKQYQKDLANFVRDYSRLDSTDARFGKPWLFPVPTIS